VSIRTVTRRAIDVHEGKEVDGSAINEPVRQAVALNRSGKSKPPEKANARPDVERPFVCPKLSGVPID
jgi:hypothetical protein